MSEGKAHTLPGDEKTVLIVDDDRDIGDILQQIILDQTNYKVVWIAESESRAKCGILPTTLFTPARLYAAQHGWIASL